MAVSSDMYQRGLAQRAGAQGGFDPYSTMGWDKRKPDWDTNWQQWEVNREYAGDDGRQVRGRFSSPDRAGYGSMLSGTVTGPAAGVARGSVNVALNNNFNRSTATNPAAEIGHLDSAINSASTLFRGICEAVEGAVVNTRNLRRVQAKGNELNNAQRGTTASLPNVPAAQRNLRNDVTLQKRVANWSDEEIKGGGGLGGYGTNALGQMRNMAQGYRTENAVRRGGSPDLEAGPLPLGSTPAPTFPNPGINSRPKGPVGPFSKLYSEKQKEEKEKQGKGASEQSANAGAAVTFPPQVNTNDSGTRKASRQPSKRSLKDRQRDQLGRLVPKIKPGVDDISFQ